MLNLAQVQKNPTSGKLELQILAYQIDDSVWEVNNSSIITVKEQTSLIEGALVLLEKEADNVITNIKPATDWILSLLQKHLTKNAVNPQFIAAEQSKIEEWRQEITVQNLELNRRFLEIETRREQLQELEQALKQEQEQLQLMANRLKQEQA
jgi:type I site-specific restriction-modification system R (restriction) subunit